MFLFFRRNANLDLYDEDIYYLLDEEFHKRLYKKIWRPNLNKVNVYTNKNA